MLYRPAWASRDNRTIAALVVAAILLTAWHHAAGDARSAPERMARAALVPLQAAVSATCSKTAKVWQSLMSAGELAEELERLRRERDALANRNLKLHEMGRRNKLMLEQLGFQPEAAPPELPAMVIAHSSSSAQPRTITIKVSRARELHEGDVVVVGTPRGNSLVGRVTWTDGAVGEVTLLLDRSSFAAAILQRSRYRGMIQPPDAFAPDSDDLRLIFLPKEADVRIGDVVLTFGEGEVYPPGLPIGQVTSVEPSRPSDVSRAAVVEPFADFDHLEYVLVVRR
ncbi:MAG: rod shape-determining protein MreC [Armatimonadota bacterium]